MNYLNEVSFIAHELSNQTGILMQSIQEYPTIDVAKVDTYVISIRILKNIFKVLIPPEAYKTYHNLFKDLIETQVSMTYTAENLVKTGNFKYVKKLGKSATKVNRISALITEELNKLNSDIDMSLSTYYQAKY